MAIVAVDEAATRFLGEPQPAEVFHSGVWHPGALLGWRHDAEGRCWVRVRCVVGGLRHTAWTDLASVRLPETAAADPGCRRGARTAAGRRSPCRARAAGASGRPGCAVAARGRAGRSGQRRLSGHGTDPTRRPHDPEQRGTPALW